jgi:hypothetical protein
MSPWAWLAALAAGCLVLASSTALYAINPGLQLDLPWWSAVVAPALVYALVLPLCVARIRVGGWLIGFGLLAALHLGLGMATAWLYAQVTLVSIWETLAPALWSFAPALVLEMVGTLLMTLPFLGALAPRAPAPRERTNRIMAEANARGEKFDLSALAGTARQPRVSPAPPKESVAPPPAPAILSSPPPPVTAIAPEVEERSLPVEHTHTAHAAAPTGTNGSSPETVEDMTEVAPPENFRDAVLELLGRPVPESTARIEDVVEPPVTVVRDESASASAAVLPAPVKSVESVPSPVTPVESAPSSAPETPNPAASSAVVRIPFDRVAGQLPPGAFRVPLSQLGARLREPETLLVAHTLIVPQLGEGVVQVAWEDVADQFPSAVIAVAPAEVKERIVNGRLLLPLDEIVRQLSPNVFGSSLGRSLVEVPGIESFPAPFKPIERSEPTLSPVPEPARHVERTTIEVPPTSQVAADLDGVAIAAPSEAAVTAVVEPALPEPSPVAAAPHTSLLAEEADRAQSETLETPAPLPAPVVESVHEREVESPVIPAPEPAAEGEQVRIPFERVLAQLPPGAFRVPLDQVGARLSEPGALLVPQALVVPQLTEGAVYAPWETVAAQFPAAVLAIDPADVKKRLEEGRLSLPLDEIVRQLPPAVFGAAMARGPVHVPGIESFPAPFTPMQRKTSALAATPVVEPASAPSPSITASVRSESVSSPSPSAPAPTRSPVVGVAAPPVHERAVGEPAPHSATLKLVPPSVTPTIDVSIAAPSALVERTRPPEPIRPAYDAADSGTAAESSASSAPVPEPPAPIHDADDPRRELGAFAAPGFTASTNALEGEAATREPAVPPTVSTVVPASEAAVLEPPAFPVLGDIAEGHAREAAVLEPPAPLPAASEIVPAEGPREAIALAPTSFPEPLSKEPTVPEPPPAPFPAASEIVPAKALSQEPTVPEPPPAPFPTVREIVPAKAFLQEPTALAPPPPLPTVRDIAPVEAVSKDAAVPEPPALFPTTTGVVSIEPPGREPVLEPPAPLEARDLSVSAPVVVPPMSPKNASVPTLEPRPPMSTSPQPVPVAPLYEPRVFERPIPAEPTPPSPARREHLEKIAALMGPLATVAPDEARVGDFTIISVSAAGMAAGMVTAAAGRLCPIMARGASHLIEQVTLRGAGGMLVLTPVGSAWSSGPTLAVGMRTGGALARLEMLSRSAATSKIAREPVRGAAPFARLDEAPTPPAIVAAAEDLTSFGPLAVHSYRAVGSGALVHCLVAPGVSAAALAPFAWELARVMAQSAPADALGAFHSAVLRSEKTRVEIRALPAPAGPSQILVVAGSDTSRPGLARLQVERTAARLSEA